MPVKHSEKSHAAKLFKLLGLLVFSDDRHSLTKLAEELNCTKPTVRNLVADLRDSFNLEVEEHREGQRLFFKGKKLGRIPAAQQISKAEMRVMQMCRIFSEHLLGKDCVEKARTGLQKSAQLTKDTTIPSETGFSSFCFGTIDYTPFQDTINTILKAIRNLNVCKITYQGSGQEKEKTYHIMPLKLFSHGNTLYLHARIARPFPAGLKRRKFDPMIAVHRIKDIELTDKIFEFPDDYNFEKVFSKTFGVMKDKPFKLTVAFTGWAKDFVKERIWSADQKIVNKKNGSIELTFTASSESEVISWVLSFGEHAQVVRPGKLVEDMVALADKIRDSYKH